MEPVARFVANRTPSGHRTHPVPLLAHLHSVAYPPARVAHRILASILKSAPAGPAGGGPGHSPPASTASSNSTYGIRRTLALGVDSMDRFVVSFHPASASAIIT